MTAFFVLSGFLITWLLLKENEESGTVASQPVVLQLAAGTILTVMVATASYYLIERPFLKLKKVWANYRRPLVATA